jgi:hypothetical protein
MPQDHDDPKLCLTCARRKLAGQPEKPCGDCSLLNVDPMAQVRAQFVRPSPLRRFSFEASVGGSSGWTAQKPPRATRGGYSL